MDATEPLPDGFQFQGYTIRKHLQVLPLCHKYLVADFEGREWLVKEFCPHGFAVRVPVRGVLHYPENTDVERDLMPLKNKFESIYLDGAVSGFYAHGTQYLFYEMESRDQDFAGETSSMMPPAFLPESFANDSGTVPMDKPVIPMAEEDSDSMPITSTMPSIPEEDDNSETSGTVHCVMPPIPEDFISLDELSNAESTPWLPDDPNEGKSWKAKFRSLFGK